MAELTSSGRWVRRPGLTAQRLILFALATLFVLALWELTLVTGSIFYSLGLGVLALLLGFKMGRLVMRALERLGLFGRVTLDDGRLRSGFGAPEVRVGEPLELAITHQQVTVSHTFRTSDVGLTSSRMKRTERKAVTILQGLIVQDGNTLRLVADDARKHPFLELDLKGLSYHRTPLTARSGTVVRMHPEDLAALLKIVSSSEGCSVVSPPEAPETTGDPRFLFWPRWKTVVGALLLVGVGAWLAVVLLEHTPGPKKETIEEKMAREAKQAKGARAEADAWIGRRVYVPADQGGQIRGRVAAGDTRVEVDGPDTIWVPWLKIEIESLHDVHGNALAEGAEIAFRNSDETIQVGDTIDVPLGAAKGLTN